MKSENSWLEIDGSPAPELAAAIEAEVARKMAGSPEYAAEIDRLARQKDKSQIKDETEAALVFLRDNYDPDAPKRIFSHRPVIGRLIVKLKYHFYHLVHDVLELTLQNQAVYNFFVSNVCRSLRDKIDQQQERIDRLEAEVKSLRK